MSGTAERCATRGLARGLWCDGGNRRLVNGRAKWRRMGEPNSRMASRKTGRGDQQSRLFKVNQGCPSEDGGALWKRPGRCKLPLQQRRDPDRAAAGPHCKSNLIQPNPSESSGRRKPTEGCPKGGPWRRPALQLLPRKHRRRDVQFAVGTTGPSRHVVYAPPVNPLPPPGALRSPQADSR